MTSAIEIPFTPSTFPDSEILNPEQIHVLRTAMTGRVLVLHNGLGVDSTAVMVVMREAGIRPEAILFADTGNEKSVTYRHLEKLQDVVKAWGWPPIQVCVNRTLDSTPYDDLYGNCIETEALPSIAFGMGSCSLKWKITILEKTLTGSKRGVNQCESHSAWLEAEKRGEKILSIIGFDSGPADIRRAKRNKPTDSKFDYVYPLQLIGWKREDCVQAIVKVLGQGLLPEKSACYFCPSSKIWELYWLAAHEPNLLEKALLMERTALTGKHSHLSSVQFGPAFTEAIKNATTFPSAKTCVGLGRSFSWNQWAFENDVMDSNFIVHRTDEARERFLKRSSQEQGDGGNAHDSRTAKPIVFVKSLPNQLAIQFG